MSLKWTGAQRKATLGWQMNTNILYIIYKNKISVSHRYHLAGGLFLCSNSTSCTSYPTLNILQTRIQDIQTKPGQSPSIAECPKDTDVKWKQNSPSQLPKLFEKLGFLPDPADMWTHVQQQHSSQEGLSLAVTNLLIVNRVSLKERMRANGHRVSKHVSQRVQKMIREKK